MSIAEPNTIDIVAVRANSSIVRLVIADHLDWSDFDAHAGLLQDKINTYLQFVESGQLSRMQNPTIPASPDVHIALALQFPPTAEAEEFFIKVREFLQPLRVGFDVEVRGVMV